MRNTVWISVFIIASSLPIASAMPAGYDDAQKARSYLNSCVEHGYQISCEAAIAYASLANYELASSKQIVNNTSVNAQGVPSIAAVGTIGAITFAAVIIARKRNE